jgi:hypothetical protein
VRRSDARRPSHGCRGIGPVGSTGDELALHTRDLGGNADTTACGMAIVEIVD